MMKKNKILNIYSLILLFIITAAAFSQEKDSLKINYSLINSVPQNASVYFNGGYTGNTPYRFMFSSADSVNGIDVVVKMKGYIDFSFRITKEDLPVNKTVSLFSTGKNPSVRDNLVIEKKSSLFKTPRKALPIILSSLVAGGGAVLGFIFKTQANDLYDEYVNTGDRSKLDKTKRYDLYSGLSLAAFQIGFTSLIYFLLIK